MELEVSSNLDWSSKDSRVVPWMTPVLTLSFYPIIIIEKRTPLEMITCLSGDQSSSGEKPNPILLTINADKKVLSMK